MLPHQNRHLFYGFLLFFLSLSVSPHIFLWQTYLSSLVCPHSFSVSFSLPTLSSFLTFVSIYLHPPSLPPSLHPSLPPFISPEGTSDPGFTSGLQLLLIPPKLLISEAAA